MSAKYFKSFSLIISFVLIATNSLNGQECNNDSLKEFDAVLAKLITFGSFGRRFPDSKPELRKWCNETGSYLKYSENYKTKCLKDLNKQAFGVFIYTMRGIIKVFCKVNSKKASGLMDGSTCFNPNRQVADQCYAKFIDELIGAQNGPDNKKIPYLCCTFNDFTDCLIRRMTNLKKCSEEKVQNIAELINVAAGNVVNLICGDYIDNSDKCNKLGAPPKKKKNQARSKSIAIPVVNLLASFKEV